jgi:hypothetical protein
MTPLAAFLLLESAQGTSFVVAPCQRPPRLAVNDATVHGHGTSRSDSSKEEQFMVETTRGAVLRRAIETCIRPDDDAIATLGDVFTDGVTVWSPNLLAEGLADLAENLRFRQGAFSDVAVQIDGLDVFGNKGLVEFRVSATFSGPFVVDEEVAIEPNGDRLLLGAAAVADFDGDKIKALRAYFDDASLLEQMLSS